MPVVLLVMETSAQGTAQANHDQASDRAHLLDCKSGTALLLSAKLAIRGREAYCLSVGVDRSRFKV